MNPRCDKCIKKVKKFQKCWRMPGEVKCMMCLHQKQSCSIDPAYAGPKKRRRTETDALMHRMPTRGTSNMSADLAIANDVEFSRRIATSRRLWCRRRCSGRGRI